MSEKNSVLRGTSQKEEDALRPDDSENLAVLQVRYRELQLRLTTLEQKNKELAAEVHSQQARALLLSHKLQDLQSGMTGMLFAPFQYARGLYRKLGKRYRVHAVAVHQLERNGKVSWRSTGEDPQFLLAADLRWQRLSGWYWLNLSIHAKEELDACFFFDFGETRGFNQRNSVSIKLPAKGTVRLPFFVPLDCRAIRFDPCQRPMSFDMELKGLVRLALRPDSVSQAASRSWEILGGAGGNWGSMVPVSAVSTSSHDEYQWASQSVDPGLQLQLPGGIARRGWYRVDLSMRSTVRHGIAKLYMNYGDGYSERDSASLPYVSGDMMSRLVYIPSDARSIRFDPLERVADFAVQHLNGTCVTQTEAKAAMLAKLTECEEFFGLSMNEIWDTLAKSSREHQRDPLLECYERYQKAHAVSRDSLSYAEWIARNEGHWFDAGTVRAQQEQFVVRPKISIVMPTYNTPVTLLRAAIDSVLNQSYENWQLCIADDNSSDSRVREELSKYVELDHRIRVVLREENGHISEASNSAIGLADGDFIALLDHDDLLAKHALHYVVHYLQKNPTAKIIYSDEDKIDEKGVRSEPHFKPDWNPDLFFSQNYVSHLGVYRRDIIQKIGGFRKGVEGSQDYDLLLRCLPFVGASEIIHIPMVLYHWRTVEGSTAKSADHKSYTEDAGIRALQDFVVARGMNGVKVESGLAPNTYRLRYPISQPAPLVSLLIPTRDRVELVRTCVSSILEKSDYRSFEIIIIDNESCLPETLEYFESIQKTEPSVKVISYPHPFNYSAINNFGARFAAGEIIGLINNDIEVISPGWLSEMVGHAMRPEIGCVGAKLYYGDDTIQHAGVIVGLGGVAGHSHKYFPRDASGYFHRLKVIQNFSAVTAACLLVRKSVYMEVGGLEENGLKVAFNDVDFCLKVRNAGYRNLWTPYAELYHHESKSRGQEDTPEKMARFAAEIEFVQKKWGKDLTIDPCYSRNLTLAREDFSIS